MVKHQSLDHDIDNSLTRIISLEVVYLVRKKLLILKRIKKTTKYLKLASFFFTWSFRFLIKY